MPNPGRHVPINGLDLYYERTGSGEPVVLVHGGLLTIDLSWARLIPRLAKTHDVIAVELQGHGHTTDSDRPFTPANNAADLIALLDHLGIDRAVSSATPPARPPRGRSQCATPTGSPSWCRCPGA